MINRRAFLAGVAPAGALVLTACATATIPPTTIPPGGISPNFLDQVITTLRGACSAGLNFIPTAATIVNIVASIFGPAAVATVQFISGAVVTVANAICAALPPVVPVAATRHLSLHRGIMRSAIIKAGTTAQGIPVIGYYTFRHR